MINGFQKRLRLELPNIESWSKLLAEEGEIEAQRVQYETGYRSINETEISIHHDDVIALTIALMENSKFRQILIDRYPVILIDEYQDTDKAWIDSIKCHFLGREDAPQFGFFGDHWQKIYGEGCGQIEHPNLIHIGKEANFRSVRTVVDCLNRIRPELPQFVVDPNIEGEVRVFHTNPWRGERQRGGHWGGDLPNDVAENALQTVLDQLKGEGWELSPETTKVLMLTHRALASRQGYPSIPDVFQFNESFTNKEHPYIAFFDDVLEPACDAYLSRKYGEMFRAFGSKIPAIRTYGDKRKWSEAMDRLIELRNNATVGDVVAHLLAVLRAWIPDAVARREREMREFRDSEGELSRVEKELKDLHDVPYQEIVALCRYLTGILRLRQIMVSRVQNLKMFL